MAMHDGHRDRLREKIVSAGIESLQPHEILEFLLFAFIPRKDTNAIAHELINTFGCRPIPEIIEFEGEEVFRRIETYTLGEMAKRSGLVIATGGGVVTRPENLPLLRQNSVTVLLHRPVEDLPSDGRPLSQKFGVKALYEKRKPLYETFGEYKVECTGVEETVDKILEVLEL